MSSRFCILTGAALYPIMATFYLAQVFGLDAKATGDTKLILLGVVGLCLTLSVVPASRLSDRIGRKKVIYGSCLAGAVGLGIGAVAPILPVALVGAAIFAVGAGAFLAVDWALMSDIVPKASTGRYMGISNVATASAGTVALALGGAAVMDTVNHCLRLRDGAAGGTSPGRPLLHRRRRPAQTRRGETPGGRRNPGGCRRVGPAALVLVGCRLGAASCRPVELMPAGLSPEADVPFRPEVSTILPALDQHLFALEPQYRERVWGGRRLRASNPPIGEAWIAYGQSRFSSGRLAGRTLREVTAGREAQLLGTAVASRFGPRFPLLVKLLDCADWLSVQVHPND